MADRPRPPLDPEPPARPSRPEINPVRPVDPNRPLRPERPDGPLLPDRPDRPEIPDRPDRPDIPDRPDRPDRPPTDPPLADPPPAPDDPPPALDPSLRPSITSWTRLEPRCREADMRTTLAARVFDPLWLLTRQWQTGEFQGEDAGMPVLARVRARSARLSRCYLGEIPANTPTQAAAYDPLRLPLEVMVEQQRARPATAADVRALTLRVDAGLHFLHMLEKQPIVGDYRIPFSTQFALQRHQVESRPDADEDTIRFLRTMAGRAIDGGRLADACRADGGPAAIANTPALHIAPGDRAEVETALAAWLAWYDALFSEPAPAAADAWLPERMEYAVTVAGRLSDDPFDERPLTAAEFYDGHLDWSSFDLDLEVNLGTQGDRAVTPIVETTIPAPITFRGAPAPRFWEFEDARIEYGLLPVGQTDVAQLLMIEYASSYGNDWFVIPLTLAVGSLTTVDSLVVTDSFGVRMLLRPIGDRTLPAPHWRMFQLAYIRRPGDEGIAGAAENLLFLPPSLGKSISGPALEDVLFMRDEMANLAWAIERSVETPLEAAAPRVERPVAAAAAAGSRLTEAVADETTPPSAAAPPPRYLLASTVPHHWIPLLPVQVNVPPDKIVSRLRRGAVLQPDGSQTVHPAVGRILAAGGKLEIFDEEVPREGVHVTRHWQMARWIDGKTFAWQAYRKGVGGGEGSSGLRFDSLEPAAPPHGEEP